MLKTLETSLPNIKNTQFFLLMTLTPSHSLPGKILSSPLRTYTLSYDKQNCLQVEKQNILPTLSTNFALLCNINKTKSVQISTNYMATVYDTMEVHFRALKKGEFSFYLI